ncbi:MAG: hypothetical protein QX197_14755 [Methylococcaceae bacterium]
MAEWLIYCRYQKSATNICFFNGLGRIFNKLLAIKLVVMMALWCGYKARLATVK